MSEAKTGTGPEAKGGKGPAKKPAAKPAAGKAQPGRTRAAKAAPAPDVRPGLPRGASEIFATVPFTLKRHASPHGQVTAVSMMKDEGPYVIEWVAHHLAVGFSDLVVYTNDCSDGTDDMLIRLEELGLAHHRRNDIPEGIRPQPSALNYAQDEPVVGLSDWVMVFDADEFLSIRYGDGTLDDLIAAAKAQDANGIVVTWRIFGSGGVVDWSTAPVSEQYLLAAPQDWNKGWGVKTLFKFDPENWKLGIHRPKMKTKAIKAGFADEVKWLNGSGREMEDYFKFRGWRSITRTVGYDWVQLNHYAVKSVDSYAIRKLRGNVNNKKDKYNSDYWSLQDRNEVRDDTMLRYTARRDEIILELLKDPVLARLHEAALARVDQRLAEIRGTEAYTALVADLARAGQVPIQEIVAKPPQARDPEKIAALMSDIEKTRNEAAREKRRSAPREAVEALPSGAYLSQPRANPGDAGDWVANHGVLLPLDPGVFSPPGLALIAKGKFDRGLARRLPQLLPRDARVTEIGAGIGFLAAHLAALRPDLHLSVSEGEPELRRVLDLVWAQNGRRQGERLRLLEDGPLTEMITRTAPEALLLADPRITPDGLADILARVSPAQIFLYGRLIEAGRDRLEEYARVMEADYIAAPGFDAGLTMFRIAKNPAGGPPVPV
ncbi:glycosyltransferase family 2 protein [Pseudomonas sp. GX19020]|uniref:glycosyltransferase family 2 protein n=1 Tax=Pseudomonas sp. GX19020 TaxID=2942277 RepID=UPI002019FEF6|nr:glycosyltransferase family 2 protein [Pseudomonas sp. GX19020]MCL4068763.1 glycosyltransferase family 2 protein [Pseudomonas sp. GX19020]